MSHTFVDTLEDVTALSRLSRAPGHPDRHLVSSTGGQLGGDTGLTLTLVQSGATLALLRGTLDRDRVRSALRRKHNVTFHFITVNVGRL